MPKTPKEKICPDCNGTGKLENYCEHHNGHPYIKEDCAICGGSGRIDEYICGFCDGHGTAHLSSKQCSHCGLEEQPGACPPILYQCQKCKQWSGEHPMWCSSKWKCEECRRKIDDDSSCLIV